ncbi:Solute carrier family 2 facilitated glucose transporter member 11 [Dissostichus eleginoides]|uniref:Solute carrier family 2, facilitated glucose transporter member 5 n=1 Tax=Dissostichus eleginoides TaxID=100907 RepID=A0AAD9BE11_DISEL|nr:Solute carrier family 2 facilitated glucose transporter member 11 [Dissostichus eleginoides]
MPQMDPKGEPEETIRPSIGDEDGGGGAIILALTICSAAIGGTFQYGYNISIINAPTSYIQTFINDTYMERWGSGLESSQLTLMWTIIVSAFSLGGLLGALLAGPLSFRFGRKNSLLLNNGFLFAGAVLVLTSRVAKSFEMIIFARFLVGVNSGVSMNVQPMYFGESAPKHLRGAVAFSSAVFTAFGIFLGQVVGLSEVMGAQHLWPYLLASNALPGLIQLLTLPWFPESPRYLLIDRGDKEACVKALGRLRGGVAPILEVEEMLEEQEQQKSAALNSGSSANKTPWTLFKDAGLRSQLRTVMAASSAMMLCGNDSIYFYAYYIFLAAGIPPQKIQYITIGTGASEFTASILSNILIERVDVDTFLLEGVSGILPAEIFDQSARPAAYMVAGSCMWISLFLVGMLFPFIVKGLGDFCFLPFFVVCVVSAVFLGLTLPETKGKTLAEITADFDGRNGKQKEYSDVEMDEPMKEQYQLGKAASLTNLMLDPDSKPDLESIQPQVNV